MKTPNVCTPTTGNTGTIFVALELSRRTWLVTIHSPDRDRISHYKVDGGDHVGLLKLIARVRARSAKKLGYEPAVVSCYEAGYDGFWLHRLLTAAGIKNHVFDAASIMVEQRARRAKTDRIDGDKLERTLRQYCGGDRHAVRIVRVPSPEQEDLRRDTREEERLLKAIGSRGCYGCTACRLAIHAGATTWTGSASSAIGQESLCRRGFWRRSRANMRACEWSSNNLPQWRSSPVRRG